MAKHGNIVAHRMDTKNVSEDYQKHFHVSRTQNVCQTHIIAIYSGVFPHISMYEKPSRLFPCIAMCEELCIPHDVFPPHVFSCIQIYCCVFPYIPVYSS